MSRQSQRDKLQFIAQLPVEVSGTLPFTHAHMHPSDWWRFWASLGMEAPPVPVWLVLDPRIPEGHLETRMGPEVAP